MSAVSIAGHLAVLTLAPILIVGIVNRTKAIWAGRKGPPLLQAAWDLRRLLGKRPVYSSVTTPLVRIAPWVILATTVVSGLIVPLVVARGPMSFPYDFVFFAYAWGLGRIFLMLGALDTGSAFEGMGASREATYSAMIEPAFFLSAGTLALATGQTSFAEILRFDAADPGSVVVRMGCLVALFVLLQVESARIPVDNPNTHLELTMIHEVMILDHSGPDLAALQYAAAMKLTVCAALLAALVNPFHAASQPAAFAAGNLALLAAAGICVGTVESLIARLKLRVVPQYVLIAIVAALVALLASSWRGSGHA
jgi:formate hydrogenlyase subunit 4